jgi:hypothetical protein
MQTLLYLNCILEAKEVPPPPVQEPVPPPPPSPEQVQAQLIAANLENIQKYILFNKLITLKYQLENSDLTQFDPKLFSESLYYLDILITFFDTFTLIDLTNSLNYLLDRLVISVTPTQKNPKVVEKVQKAVQTAKQNNTTVTDGQTNTVTNPQEVEST